MPDRRRRATPQRAKGQTGKGLGRAGNIGVHGVFVLSPSRKGLAARALSGLPRRIRRDEAVFSPAGALECGWCIFHVK